MTATAPARCSAMPARSFGSDPLQRCGRVCVSSRLTVRTEGVVGAIARSWSEPDDAALDGEQPLALRLVQGLQEVRRRKPADLDRELDVELLAQDGQRADQLGCAADVPIHPTDSSP